jgi:nonsense-mediated mRNA decay protein 3
MVCPLCGRKSEVGLFCAECYLKKNLKLELAEKLELSHCPKCDAYLLSGKWVKDIPAEKAVTQTVKKAIESNISKLDKAGVMTIDVSELGKGYEATVKLVLGETEIIKKTFVRIINNTCPDCSRVAGGYFEAVLQLRGSVGKSTVDKIVGDVENHKDRLAFVSEIKKVQGGYDIYLGSKKSAEKIVKNFRGDAEIKKSFTQAGFDHQHGKAKNRFYYLVRL